MKKIKLSGREQAVLRAIDYATGSTGAEICEHARMDGADIVDILTGLCDAGYVEAPLQIEKISLANFGEARFEINPSYALDLKEAMRRS